MLTALAETVSFSPKCLADRQIESGVRRQVRRAVPIQKSRAELIRRRRPHVARQGQGENRSDGVALIVIEEKIAGRSEFQQSSGNRPDSLPDLIRVSDSPLRHVEKPRRAQRDFGAADDRAEIRQRNKNAGVADHIVIQEIARAGVEIIHVERPSAHRNAQSDIVLDIALARQRNEAETLRHRKIERRTGEAVERRRLVVIRVVAVQRPVQARNADGRAEPRIGGVLIEQARVVREPDAEIESEPRSDLVLIFQK